MASMASTLATDYPTYPPLSFAAITWTAVMISSSSTIVNLSQHLWYGEDFSTLFNGFERMNKQTLCDLSTAHGIYFEKTSSADTLKNLMFRHITSGRCTRYTLAGYIQIRQSSEANPSESGTGVESLKIELLFAVQPKIKSKPLQRTLRMNWCTIWWIFETETIAKSLAPVHGISTHAHAANRESAAQSVKTHNDLCSYSVIAHPKQPWARWPVPRVPSLYLWVTLSPHLLNQLLSTYSVALEIFLLRGEEQKPPMPYRDGPLCDVFVDPAGVSVTDSDRGRFELMLCSTYRSSLYHDKVRPLALANQTF